MTTDKPQRRRPVHGVIRVEGQPTIVFLTICTHQKKPILVNQITHDLLLDVWQEALAWRVGRYVVMPDHIHLFAGHFDPHFSIDAWVRYWKSLFTRRVDNTAFKWQAGYWDTRMRSAKQYESKWRYVKNNPVRHQLVEAAHDWPYSGEPTRLPWE